ncbi:hypothetical protein PANT111_40052 [Pantoea brenneri]|uniref:Uncharacterized protein n=1 Tax=Pantoea brenneri TaxID=472694 RepID=A0AAX3JA68_9GAMM|nr:hypothetical protein PANT111_40052 [Pantoea brenneri]
MISGQTIIGVINYKSRFSKPFTEVLTSFYFIFNDQYFHLAPLADYPCHSFYLA